MTGDCSTKDKYMSSISSPNRVVCAILDMMRTQSQNMHILKLDEGLIVEIEGQRFNSNLVSVVCMLHFDRSSVQYSKEFNLSKLNWKAEVQEFIQYHLEEGSNEGFKY